MTGAKFTHAILSAALIALAACCSSSAFAQAGLVAPAARAGARELVEALEGFAVRTPTSRLVDEMAEAGGGAAIEEFSARLVDEGGEAALGRAARLVQEVGPTAIATLAKAPRPVVLLNVLDGLPADVAQKAIRALGRGADGQAMADAIGRFGADALKLELQHPGVGTKLAQDLGEGGIAIAQRMPTEDAILLARRSQEIALLPEAQKQAVLEGASKHLGDFVRFLESNPKFTFTVAATAVLLKEGDQMFGSSQIAIDANGNPVLLTKPGFIERFVQIFLAGIAGSILAPIGLALAIVTGGWGAIKLWFLYRRHRSMAGRA